MSNAPQIRALTSHVALDRIATLPPSQRDAILADAGDVQRARDAFQFGWIPMSIQIGILDAMRRHLSPTEWHASQQALMRGYLDKPVLRGLFDTAMRVLGLSVHSLSKWAPRAFDALFKDAGTLTYERGDGGHAALYLTGFPRELFASGSFHSSMQASFELIFELAKTEGHLSVTDHDVAAGNARYVLDWNE